MKQLIRYGIIGITTNLSIYLVYLVITYLGAEPKAAMTFVYIMGAAIGFVGNRIWTFSHRGPTSGAALRYGVAHLFGYLLNFLLLYIFVDHLGYAHQWVQAVAIIIVAGFLFIVFKFFVFRKKCSAS